MSKKEKIELEIKILEDLKDCFSFSFSGVEYNFDKGLVAVLIEHLKGQLNEN